MYIHVRVKRSEQSLVDKFCVSQMFYDTVEGPISRHPRKAEKVPWSHRVL